MISRVASAPFIPGIKRSIRTTFGRLLPAQPHRRFAVRRGPGNGMLRLTRHDPAQGFRGNPQIVYDGNPHGSAFPISSRTAWIKVSS